MYEAAYDPDHGWFVARDGWCIDSSRDGMCRADAEDEAAELNERAEASAQQNAEEVA